MKGIWNSVVSPIDPNQRYIAISNKWRYIKQEKRIIEELAERSSIIIQNSSNPSSRKNLDIRLLELISLTLVCGLVDPSLFTFLLKLLQWGLASIYQGKLESPLIYVTLRMTFLSRQSFCVVIVPSQLANHAWLRIIVLTYWVSTLGLSTQLQNQFLP